MRNNLAPKNLPHSAEASPKYHLLCLRCTLSTTVFFLLAVLMTLILLPWSLALRPKHTRALHLSRLHGTDRTFSAPRDAIPPRGPFALLYKK